MSDHCCSLGLVCTGAWAEQEGWTEWRETHRAQSQPTGAPRWGAPAPSLAPGHLPTRQVLPTLGHTLFPGFQGKEVPSCLLEDKGSSEGVEGQSLVAGGPQVGAHREKPNAGPWWCPRNKFKSSCGPGRGRNRNGAGSPSLPFIIPQQSIYSLINSLQRPLNYSSWATERTIRASPTHSSGSASRLGRKAEPLGRHTLPGVPSPPPCKK